MPILHWPGAMMPGQLGPTSLVLPCVFRMSVIRTMSCCGMPSVMQTTSGISASIASSILAAASGGLLVVSFDVNFLGLDVPYGTKIADAVAPVSFTASLTLAKTGFPRCVSPAFFGFVPPTTFVPV